MNEMAALGCIDDEFRFLLYIFINVCWSNTGNVPIMRPCCIGVYCSILRTTYYSKQHRAHLHFRQKKKEIKNMYIQFTLLLHLQN